MPNLTDFLTSIQQNANGVSLAQLLVNHPDLTRRTAQRWISQLISERRILAVGEGRARHYFPLNDTLFIDDKVEGDTFPSYVPLSTDSVDILNYVNQELGARHPVGYQHDFLESYIPNQTWYLSASLRRQLRKMGKAIDVEAPSGTYSRAILVCYGLRPSDLAAWNNRWRRVGIKK